MQDAIEPEYTGHDNKIEMHVVQADNDADDTGYSHGCNIDSWPVQTQQRQINRRHHAKGYTGNVCK